MPNEGDPVQSAADSRKHGETFEEAAVLLGSDTDDRDIDDERRSEDQERFIAIGPVGRSVIVRDSTDREDGVVRVVRAPKATKTERGRYEEFEKARRPR